MLTRRALDARHFRRQAAGSRSEEWVAMTSTIIGGAMLPHAPQFFTLPDTEDMSVVAAVKKVGAEIGERLKALKPDLWIIFSNDHAGAILPPGLRRHLLRSMSAVKRERRIRRHAISIGRSRGEIGFELVRQTCTGRGSILRSQARLRQDRLRDRHSADASRSIDAIPSCRSTSTPICRRSRRWNVATRSGRRSHDPSALWA